MLLSSSSTDPSGGTHEPSMAERFEDPVEYTEDGDDAEEEDDDDDGYEYEEEAAQLANRFQSLVSLAPLGTTGSGGGHNLSQQAGASLSKLEKKTNVAKPTGLTRDERATVEQVLDPRTRLLLFKLINSGVLSSINGCVSTGKEANVYHAFGSEEGAEFAVKVYKTSILVFRDRDRYVSGEFRFRHGYCKANPRKMVRMWAEKEMRNYRRLAQAEVPCPSVHLLREHVLMMGFLGRDGHAAPRLKDASLTDDQYLDACRQTCLLLRTIYQRCKLVHGDFSEYNLLWYKRTVYVIDVSQSVEHDHTNALVFLRKDCENTIHFYRKRGVSRVISLQKLFDFVVDPRIKKEQEEEIYDRLADEAEQGHDGGAAGGAAGVSDAAVASGDGDDAARDEAEAAQDVSDAALAESQVAEAVFAQMHIPRTLEELHPRQIEKDIAAARSGHADSLAYGTVVGLGDLDAGPGEQQARVLQRHGVRVDGVAKKEGVEGDEGEEDGEEEEGEEEDDEEDDEEDGEEDDEGEEGEERRRGRRKVLHKEEDKDEKKLRKAATKAAKAEARLHKTPKHVKKAAKKNSTKKK